MSPPNLYKMLNVDKNDKIIVKLLSKEVYHYEKKSQYMLKEKKSKKMVRILSKRTIEEKMTYFVYFFI